ncbi:DUF3857 domain-containing protein [Hyunsoonleella pacifica]|uniref:DUF3857 domain-containing protein n=1 Tax=Hyunsoonleella pacifica TaxID=1080224 RepID=A0A4Q9FKZ9_9FLAO|nr:DUF3857 domain-containing protein [Hyunsoonleella pacifica]TBN14481.1 DUF3857 domain-containing protein [Hyunsoonleella pacifica]GGD14092.1 hypothetical protein GCM10011368_15100 [Hyunsoonleella pacifica]
MLKNMALLVCFLFSFKGISQNFSYSSLSIPDNLKEHANAVVRLHKTNVVIDSRDNMTISIRRIVTVLNKAGNKFVEAGAGYDNYLKIKGIEAIVYDAAGKQIKKFKKKDFIDHSAVDGGTLYSDSRMLFMGYTPIKYPYTVEFICEIKTPNTAAIPSWKPLNGYFVSVEKNSYEITDNANLGLRFKEKNFKGYETIKSHSTENTLNYSIENVKALRPEDLSPSLGNISPYVLVTVEKFHYNGIDGNASNWKEMGDWIKHDLLEGRDKVSEETKAAILQLVENVEDPLEKAKLVYNYVQGNTRYISVQVGIGGIQPIAAMEVDELKYGDCKGLTNYTQALLGIAGVESYYTVVEAGKEIVDFEDDFPSLAQGNHIILCIPKEEDMIWLDCTSQIHPFGFIGDFTDDRAVLVVKEDKSEVIKTVNYPDTKNHQSMKATIDLKEDASINASIEIKTKGIQYDNRFFLENQSKKDVLEYYKESWGYVNGLDVEAYKFKNNKDDVEFLEAITAYARNYASKVGDRIIFHANVFNRNSFVPDRYRHRTLPLQIQRGYLDEDDFTIKIPSNYTIEALPENIIITNKYGEYQLNFVNNDDNYITVKRKLLIKKGEYPSAEYKAYRMFRKSVSNNDNLKIVLKKSI